MLENILYSLNIISLLFGILILFFQCVWGGFTTKNFFNTTKLSILASVAFSILFYNKGIWPDFFMVNSYTVLFYSLTAFITFAWLSLSYRWFTNEDAPACRFCMLVLGALICFNLILTTVNIGVLALSLSGIAFINYSFLRLSQESEELHLISHKYGWSALFFTVLMFGLMAYFPIESWHYQQVAEYIGASNSFNVFLLTGGILFYIIFLIGIAPFNFWVSDAITPAVLPVAAYFNMVPFFSLWGLFIKINYELFRSVATELSSVYICFGVLSVVLGAIGANSSRNLRKIFSYLGLYNVGVMVMMISSFTPEAILGTFVYMQVYILAIFGVYTSFYSFKSGGVYLNNLSMIAGIYKVRPYISGAMLFFMASLMSIAPLPGFLGQFSALYIFAGQGQYLLMFIVLLAGLVLMAACLQIIRTMYFAAKHEDFDRSDNGVYFYLIINMLLIAVLVFKPQFLLRDAEIILNSVLG